MEEEQGKKNDLIGTTDSLEAVGVFRCWKNFLFMIVVLSLMLLLGSFWLVDLGYMNTDETKTTIPPMASETIEDQIPAETLAETPPETLLETPVVTIDEIVEAAKQIAPAPNQPAIDESQPKKTAPLPEIKLTFKWLARFMKLINFILIPTAILYCLTILFSLKISLLGRLGGINHITRAFFLSLIFIVMLLPWQNIFGPMVTGYMFSPEKLATACADLDRADLPRNVVHYLRFVGYWFVMLAVLVFSHIRTARWTKATLRRLEII